MTDNLLDDLRSLDVDVENTMIRFMNNEAMYKKFLLKFPKDNKIIELGEIIRKKDYGEAETVAHMLKGVTGNLGLIPLFARFTIMVIDLRNKKYDNIETLYSEIAEYYEKLCETLKEYE